nr:DUF3592 domain-containing protein [Legionella sp. 27cVA30]
MVDIGWLLFLLLLFAYFWRARREIVQTRSWWVTKGQVTRCEWMAQGHRLWPKIEYIYKVNDREFIGEHLFFDTLHNNPNTRYARKVAYEVAHAYKSNESIDVFYNPEKPEQSAINITIPWKLNFILLLIGAFTLAHVTYLVLKVTS